MKYSDRLQQYLFVIRELVTREIKRKYARSSLGILWSVLNPLLNMSVMSLIFSTIFERNIENFPIYYLTGNVFWSLFTTATNTSLTSLVDNKKMLIQVKLPMFIFPLSRCCTALVNFGYSMFAYVLMLLLFRIKLNIYMPLFLLFVAGMFMFSLGFSYLLSALYVQYGDVKHLYSVVQHVWMFLSALFYPLDRLSPMMQEVVERNPIYNDVACARQCIMDGMPPTLEQWARLFIWSVGMYILGKLYFDKKKNEILQKI